MNFLSHVLTASQHSTDPRWLLGAMLPDFFTMAGVRVDFVDDEILALGVDFHHHTDHVFHSAPLVVEKMDAGTEGLLRRGMTKGAAAAIGHVGLELLLDGAMVKTGRAMDVYTSAISQLSATEDLLHFRGRREEQLARWRKLSSYLPDAAIPCGYRNPEFVADRLLDILANRPLLAVPPDKESLVYAWAERTAPEIELLAPAVFAQVEELLSAIEYDL